jgi:hypothetical protein
MIKKCLFLLPVLFALLVKGQDVITLKSGDQIKAKVLSADTSRVKYKLFGLNDSTVYSINKMDVAGINYQNGSADIYSYVDKKTPPSTKIDSTDYFAVGSKDAEKYYGSFSCPAATGTFWTSILFGVIGLIPAVACASTPPKDRNLHLRHLEMKDNPTYMQGYREQAYRIKKRRVWTNFGIGAGIGIIATILLSNVK